MILFIISMWYQWLELKYTTRTCMNMHIHIYRKQKWMRRPFLCFCRQWWATGEGGVQRFGDSHGQLCLVVWVGPSVAEKDGPIPYQSRKREGREVQKASRWPCMMVPTCNSHGCQTLNDEAKSLCSIGSHRWSTECEDHGRPTSSPDLSPVLASVACHSRASSCLSPCHFGLAGVNYCFVTVLFAITYIFSALLKCF